MKTEQDNDLRLLKYASIELVVLMIIVVTIFFLK